MYEVGWGSVKLIVTQLITIIKSFIKSRVIAVLNLLYSQFILIHNFTIYSLKSLTNVKVFQLPCFL